MIIDLIDWKDEKHPVDIGDLDNIEEMFIKVVTGDEILHVLYKDGTDKFFDSSEDRMADFDDGIYPIYVSGLWCIDKDKFINRKTSYDILHSETIDKYDKYMEELFNVMKELFE